MCTCMYICICVFMYMCIYVCVCRRVWHIYVCMYVGKYLWWYMIYIIWYDCMRAWSCMYLGNQCLQECMYIYVDKHAWVSMYACTHECYVLLFALSLVLNNLLLWWLVCSSPSLTPVLCIYGVVCVHILPSSRAYWISCCSMDHVGLTFSFHFSKRSMHFFLHSTRQTCHLSKLILSGTEQL